MNTFIELLIVLVGLWLLYGCYLVIKYNQIKKGYGKTYKDCTKSDVI